MGRLIGPDEASREVKAIVGRVFQSKAGRSAQLWADDAATIPADVLTLAGAVIPASTVTIDSSSMLPLMQYPPNDVDFVVVTCDGGPPWRAYARTDDRLDTLGGRVTTVEGVTGALGDAATRDVGTTAGTVAAGDDVRVARAVAAAPVVLWGDSHSQYGGGDGASGITGSNPIYRMRGYWTWAEVLLAGRVPLAHNAGIAGQRAAEILARFATDVSPYSPGVVVVTAGTNDVSFDVAGAGDVSTVATTVETAITAIISQIRTIGAIPVICTLPPATGYTAAQATARGRINRWINGLGASGVVVCDWNPWVIDTDGISWRTGFSYDGIHGAPIGCARMGYALSEVLEQIAPRRDALGMLGAENLCTAPVQAGTSGSRGTGVTGSVATSWTSAAEIASVTAVASKVDRADGKAGQWQQYVISAGDGLRHYHNITTGFAVGQVVQARIEFETEGITTATLASLYVEVIAFAGSTALRSAYGSRNADNDSLDDPFCVPASGVLVTAPMTIPATTDSLRIQTHLKGATGTIRWGRCDVAVTG